MPYNRPFTTAGANGSGGRHWKPCRRGPSWNTGGRGRAHPQEPPWKRTPMERLAGSMAKAFCRTDLTWPSYLSECNHLLGETLEIGQVFSKNSGNDLRIDAGVVVNDDISELRHLDHGVADVFGADPVFEYNVERVLVVRGSLKPFRETTWADISRQHSQARCRVRPTNR